MIASFLADGALRINAEDANDHEVGNCRSSLIEAALHLYSPIDAGSGSVEPREHRPPIQSDEQGAFARLGIAEFVPAWSVGGVGTCQVAPLSREIVTVGSPFTSVLCGA
jgi:hypothetical protein